MTLLPQTVPELAFHFSLFAGAAAARRLAHPGCLYVSLQMAFTVTTFRLRSQRTPSAHLTRGLVLSCHVGRRVEVAPRQSPRQALRCGGWSGSLRIREAKGNRRDGHKAEVLQLCHGVAPGMNMLTVSFLLCLLFLFSDTSGGSYSYTISR